MLATGYADLPPGVGVGIPRIPKPFGQKHLADAVDAVMRAKQEAA